MRRYLLVFAILLGCVLTGYSQNYYKLECDFSSTGTVTTASTTVSVLKANGDAEEVLIDSFRGVNGQKNIVIVLNLDFEIIEYSVDVSWFQIENLPLGRCGDSAVLNFDSASCNNTLRAFCNSNGTSSARSGSVNSVVRINKINILPPINNKPFEECKSISVPIISDCYNLEVDKWYYKLANGVERYLVGHDGENPIVFSASELSTNSIDYTDKPVELIAKFVHHPISYSTVIDIKPCSPELKKTSSTNETCVGANDGTVTLTFDKNVEAGYEMRYFIYQGTPPEDPSPTELKAENPSFPNQVFADPLGITLLDVEGGDFNGTYSELEGSFADTNGNTFDYADYYIIYQEVRYDFPNQGDVDVKSGEITPQFTISRPTQIDISIPPENINQPNCAGETGSVTIVGTGGGYAPNTDASLEYSIQGVPDSWQSSPTISGLDGGNYVFLARSQSGCISEPTDPIAIKSISPLFFSNPNSGRASSNTSADGFVTIEYDGGTPNYSFKLEKQISGTSDFNEVGNATVVNNPQIKRVDFSNLEIGTYRITITDSKGCEITSENIVVTSDPVPDLASEQTNQISCFGGSDGHVSAEVIDYTTNYKYQWIINGTASAIQLGTSGTIALNNLSEAGDYVLRVSSGRVSDADFNDPDNFSTTTATYLINEPDPVVMDSPVPNDVSCNGSNDGSIVLVLSGGTNYEYTFELAPIESDWIPLNGNTITNLPPGFYRVTVRNENGCESAPSASIFIDEPDQLMVSEITEQRKSVTTNGGNDGEIFIESSGGTGPYSFAWSGPNGFTSEQQNLVGLTAGEYQVVVTDANNCSVNLGPIPITEPGPLGITSLNATDVLCKGDVTGSITVEVSGTPPFTFIWTKDGDPSFSVPNQADIVGLSEGTYNLDLTDASGDPAVTASVSISEPLEALGGGITPIGTSCFNGSDGQITINASGGTAPYQFAIDDRFGFQDSNTFADLSARIYLVTVRDANGCLFEDNVEVVEPVAIAIDTTKTSITNATTTGGSDGAIDLEVIGGTGAYSYEWSGPNVNGSAAQNLTGLVAGAYQVLVTDDNGCTFSGEFNVGEPGPLAITNIEVTDVRCKGESSGRITSTVTGNGNITFEWREVASNNVISTAGKDLVDVPAGIYTLTIADETANPPVTSRQITVLEPENLSVDIVPTEVSCFGGGDGVLQVNVSGGTPPFSYAIDGINFQNNNQFNKLVAGNYEVMVRDANNCEVFTSGVITQPQELGIIVDQEKNLTAANTADGAISITVFGGTAPFSYQWSSDDGFTSTDEDISNLEGGTYTLVLRDANNIIDGDGCYFTRDFRIAEPGELIASLTQTVFLDCYNDDFAELTATVDGGVAPYTYQWFAVQNGSNTLLSEDSGIIGDLSTGEYFVRVTDANSISVDSAPLTVVAPDVLEIYIDGKVDVLCYGEATGNIAISVVGGTEPYQYYWDNGETTEDLSGLLAGDYVIEVVDANGCFTERSITIEAPSDPLRIASANLKDVSEYQANDGSIALEISGGSGSYGIRWNRLSDNAFVGETNRIDNLSADTYEVSITDGNGCTISESYVVSQPDIVEGTMVSPTCAGTTDGSISVVVNKGNGVFSYSWSTGDTTSDINGLPAGTYTVTISGFGDGPITRTYILEDPLPLWVDLGEDRVLCDGQQLELDATVADPTATYSWSSDQGYTSTESKVILTKTGNYTLVVEGQHGCTAQGAIFIDVSTEEISAEFAVSSQVFVGEPLILVDISYPLPERLEWIIPEEATVVKKDNDEAELVFNSPGEYEIGIITHRGPCSAQQTKKVLVLAKDGTVNEEEIEFKKKIVEDFVIFPNPTNGQFNTQIKLSERGNVSIKVFSFANNALIASEKARGESSYNISMDISGKPAGVYAIVLETPYGTSLRKIIMK
ncbi:T9SS type A sorting domain-containing protein [Sediminicola sp. 1XM1-17]|uniref:T9SS type A sorting domain-containing protein n=1 Tax=Sediminicola sp. 1XM1-17 TaxID=3127702 RepID=UPI0030786054